MAEEENCVFIVEDDPSIRFGLEEVLSAEGFVVASCDRGDEAEEKIGESLPDLIILDVMLPGENGYKICKTLRKKGCRVPILMLTAKGQEIDKVVGLDCGADDYVTKPFGVQELIARVNALLRRGNWASEKGTAIKAEPAKGAAAGALVEEPFQIGEVRVLPDQYEAERMDGMGSTRLTPKEMELLRYFHQNRGKTLSREKILDAVWGVRYFGTTRTLDQCVAQLRKKIGDQAGDPHFLVTIHGVGYKLQ